MKNSFFTLQQLAEITESVLVGDGSHRILDVADLESATATDLSFLANPRYTQAMQRSKAGAVCIFPTQKLVPGQNFLINEDPSRAFQKVVDLFHENALILSGFEGIHSTAVIHPTCKIGKNVTICPYAVIDAHVSIGDNSFIGSHCYVGPYTAIGSHCVLHPHSVVRERCHIGNYVILQPGAVIGSCGFGYTTDKQGQHHKLNQVGNVTIEDQVEIGANSTIDRARFKTTRIGRGSKLDNLVTIAHNVVLGENNICAGQVGIAGSTTTGKNVTMGGKSGLAGHLKLDDGVTIAGYSGVSKSLSAGVYSGIPALPRTEYNRLQVFIRRQAKQLNSDE